MYACTYASCLGHFRLGLLSSQLSFRLLGSTCSSPSTPGYDAFFFSQPVRSYTWDQTSPFSLPPVYFFCCSTFCALCLPPCLLLTMALASLLASLLCPIIYHLSYASDLFEPIELRTLDQYCDLVALHVHKNLWNLCARRATSSHDNTTRFNILVGVQQE